MKGKQIVGIALIALIIVSLIYSGCTDDTKPKIVTPPTPAKVEISAPEFSSDSCFAQVKKQTDFGPRVPNTKAHSACADWLTQKLQGFGATVMNQSLQVKAYDGTLINGRNIIASFQPEKKNRVLLCAHWDTRPFADKDKDQLLWKKPIDGVNDGASGVGVLLEVARIINTQPTDIGIDIILFDAEDYGTPEFVAEDFKEVLNDQFVTSWCLGSQYWAKNPHVKNYNPRFGILLDMVGATDAQFNREKFSNEVAPDVLGLVWSTAAKLGYSALFTDQEVEGVIDDHVMLNRAGYRCIDIIDTRPQVMAMGLGGYKFGQYHHTHQDNISMIDKNTLKAVGQTLLQVIYNQH